MTMFALLTFIAIIEIKPCSVLQISLLPGEAAHSDTTKIAAAARKLHKELKQY